MTEIFQLSEELKKSKGYKIFIIVEHLSVTNYIVKKNFKELIDLIGAYEKYINVLPRGESFSMVKAKNFRNELIRLLINYTSSVFALENNLRHFFKYNKQNTSNSLLLNNTKIIKIATNFTRSPERMFLFGIRNYIEHSKILNISNTVTYMHENGILLGKGKFEFPKEFIIRDLKEEFSLFLEQQNDREILLSHLDQEYPDKYVNIKDIVLRGQERTTILCNEVEMILQKDYEELAKSKKVHKELLLTQYRMFNKRSKRNATNYRK